MTPENIKDFFDARIEGYKKTNGALKPVGVYVEGDYTVWDDEVEAAMRKTAAHTTALLYEAGFAEVTEIFFEGVATVLLAGR